MDGENIARPLQLVCNLGTLMLPAHETSLSAVCSHNLWIFVSNKHISKRMATALPRSMCTSAHKRHPTWLPQGLLFFITLIPPVSRQKMSSQFTFSFSMMVLRFPILDV